MSSLHNHTNPVRLDKWLWAARFFKTRALARTAVQSGKVSYNEQRSKPGKIVEVGAILVIPCGHDRLEVVIDQVSGERRNAQLAQTLYTETKASIEKRAQNAAARKSNALYNPHPDQRPDKKQRRELIKWKHQ